MIVMSVLAIIILIFTYSLYVSLVQKRNKVQEAFSSIDVQLKKRYDLIPNILTIAQKYMEHERTLIEEVTKLRTRALNTSDDIKNIDKKISLDTEISKKVGQIMVAVEQYPELKSDQTMITAMQTYNEVEEHISAARRFYNAAALELKNAVEIFPSSVIASMVGVKAVSFFEANEVERKPVNASNYLK